MELDFTLPAYPKQWACPACTFIQDCTVIREISTLHFKGTLHENRDISREIKKIATILLQLIYDYLPEVLHDMGLWARFKAYCSLEKKV